MTTESLKLSIIIVSYNTRMLTEQTVDSVMDDLKNFPDLAKRTELILVDNNSSDDSPKYLRQLALKQPKKFKVLINDHNLGFSGANNQGIKLAKGEIILLLNSDTEVKPGALQAIVETFTTHPIQDSRAQLARTQGDIDRLGIVSALLLNTDGTVQHQGGSFPTLLSLAAQWLMLDDIPVLGKWLPSTQHTGQRATELSQELSVRDWVGGTAMAVRRVVFDEIGLLDDRIFMYGEDIEFCMRAKHHHWDVVIQPAAQVTHIGSASSSSVNAIKGEYKGYLYVWAKHKPHWQLPIAKAILKLGALWRWWLFGTMGKHKARQKAYRELWQGRN